MTITEPVPTSTTAPHVTVLVDRCVGCQECIVRCPTGALHLEVTPMVAAARDELCVGCRQCQRTCPFSAITVSGAVLVAPRADLVVHHPAILTGDTGETRRGILSWTDALTEADRCLACPDPTCVRGCPAHNDIPAFITALRGRDLAGAHDVLRRTSVLPDICARVCDQAAQCEGACTWSLAAAAPVAIGALERFVCDHAPVPGVAAPAAEAAGPRVAVIGSGPAGLAAAWELVEHGATVTIYDRDRQAGGLLRWGIPDFTLPATVAARPVDALQKAGVEFRLGQEVPLDALQRVAADYDAVVVAVGAGRALRLDVPGADLDGVWDATRFLTEAQAALAAGTSLPVLTADGRAPSVLVLGAGNTAMDVARTARRLGADVVCIDWMDRRFAPVRADELADAETEGVTIRFNTTLEALDGEAGAVRTARLSSTRQRRRDRQPRIIRRTSQELPVDLVVMALGYRLEPRLTGVGADVPVRKTLPDFVDRRWLASGLLANPAPDVAGQRPVGTLALGRETTRQAAGLPRAERIWFAGDALTGPATVVEAMAQGREAARAIIAAATQPRTTPPAG